MTVHTIKDKEIPAWRPLQGVPRLALSKLSPKRIVILLLLSAVLLFFLAPTFFNRAEVIDPEEKDDDVLLSLRKELKSSLALRGEFSKPKPAAIFATSHDLYNASGITALACDMAAARQMNVLIMFLGLDSSERVPLFLRAHQFERATCPMVWHDARHQYSSIVQQQTATEAILADVLSYLNPSVVVYVDDEEDWFMQSLERVVYWRSPAISLIQLKRTALVNLRWIASLSPSALEGGFLSE
jgi:hypothetical protein